MPADKEALIHYIWIKEGLHGYFDWYNPECKGFEDHVSPMHLTRIKLAVKAHKVARKRLENVLEEAGLCNPDPEDDDE